MRNLQVIRAYYAAAASEQVVRRFFQELDAARSLIADFPGGGRQTNRPGTRMLRLAHFPYLVFYRIFPDGELRIIQVRHARRRPLKLS
ncbi:type II toxin-antitoxin system RelE/ParE family toxin [Enterovirga sp. CN4-39]|uniref:type II toxin-antitoxin system RelE/ParE family toxin n=1 Tax=Enterovirga sp. CN4-39 TaxID=3400910 RepID=UPI003C079293